MASGTWSDIQALKMKQTTMRERIARRKKERQEVEAELIGSPVAGVGAATAGGTGGLGGSPIATTSTASATSTTGSTQGSDMKQANSVSLATSGISKVAGLLASSTASISPKPSKPEEALSLPTELVEEIEKRLLVLLDDITLTMPVESSSLVNSVSKLLEKEIPPMAVEDLLEKFAAQTWISIKNADAGSLSRFIVASVAHSQLSAVTNELQGLKEEVEHRKRKFEHLESLPDDVQVPAKQSKKVETEDEEDAVESLLSMESAKQRENKKMNEEILNLLSKPTAKEQSLIEKFKSQGGAQVKEFCPNGTKEECMKVTSGCRPCEKLHFRKIIHKHTDESLGDCSFLNTCFHMDTCKYVHYEIDYPEIVASSLRPDAAYRGKGLMEGSTVLFPPQWVQCDMRLFDMSVLGKFSVIMADPPWDIHMELPYGTMSDDEMRKLNVPVLQDDGFIFLWVTGRAMELGRECLRLWGYERIDEIIWVKTNQLQRIIRTGRTGHWLNHGKEHCLVGKKGNPININRGLDCDVIVAEVRATSHKPDEIYGIIERLAPGSRKIELFGRPHNVQPNWVTLGNQLDGVKLIDPDVVKAFKRRYPDGNCIKPS